MELLHFKASLILLLIGCGAAWAWHLKRKRAPFGTNQRMRLEQQLHTHNASCLLVSIDGAAYLIASSKSGLAIIKHDAPALIKPVSTATDATPNATPTTSPSDAIAEPPPHPNHE